MTHTRRSASALGPPLYFASFVGILPR